MSRILGKEIYLFILLCPLFFISLLNQLWDYYSFCHSKCMCSVLLRVWKYFFFWYFISKGWRSVQIKGNLFSKSSHVKGKSLGLFAPLEDLILGNICSVFLKVNLTDTFEELVFSYAVRYKGNKKENCKVILLTINTHFHELLEIYHTLNI